MSAERLLVTGAPGNTYPRPSAGTTISPVADWPASASMTVASAKVMSCRIGAVVEEGDRVTAGLLYLDAGWLESEVERAERQLADDSRRRRAPGSRNERRAKSAPPPQKARKSAGGSWAVRLEDPKGCGTTYDARPTPDGHGAQLLAAEAHAEREAAAQRTIDSSHAEER